MPLVSMKMRRGRPKTLSDPYHDFTEDGIREILSTPDDRFEWHHYQSVLGPFLPAGTYDESVYFLPGAFDFILRHDDDALDLITALVWFASEYSDRLADDGLLDAVRHNLLACFQHWTAHFVVIHFDEEGCRKKGWGLKHFDYVYNIEAVCEGSCDLVRFETHRDLAESFFASLADFGDDPIKAAWFLECARSRGDVRFPPRHPSIQNLLANDHLLHGAAKLVLAKLVPDEKSPTYWTDTFEVLGL